MSIHKSAKSLAKKHMLTYSIKNILLDASTNMHMKAKQKKNYTCVLCSDAGIHMANIGQSQ